MSAGHVPYVAQLKPGVLQIMHEDGGSAEAEKYFVAGGFALTHPDSTTVRKVMDIRCYCCCLPVCVCVVCSCYVCMCVLLVTLTQLCLCASLLR